MRPLTGRLYAHLLGLTPRKVETVQCVDRREEQHIDKAAKRAAKQAKGRRLRKLRREAA